MSKNSRDITYTLQKYKDICKKVLSKQLDE